jgi:hypothetical protein
MTRGGGGALTVMVGKMAVVRLGFQLAFKAEKNSYTPIAHDLFYAAVR